MTFEWGGFIGALGCSEGSEQFKRMVMEIGEQPVSSSTPKEYDDPLGETKFYQFIKSGIEIGFRASRLNHIHIFLERQEGYDSYTGPLMGGVTASFSEESVIHSLGDPTKVGGGKFGGVLGYVDRWIRYDFSGYAVRFQFSKTGEMQKVSLALLSE